MKKILFLFPIVFFCLTANAQWSWQIRGGGSDGQIYSALTLPNGNYVIAGTTSDGNGGTAIIVNNITSNGSMFWQKYSACNSATTDVPYSICRLSNGNYVVGGKACYSSTIIFCIDSTANNLLWNKTYGGTQTGAINKVIPGSNNKIVAAGSIGWGGRIIKTDYSGKVVWNKQYDTTNTNTSIHVFNSIVETNDFGYAVTGYSNSGGSGQAIVLMKTDSSGTVKWCKTYGSSSPCEQATDMKQTADGGYFIAGTTCNGISQSPSIILMRTDSSGNLKWSKIYESGGNNNAYSIELAPQGGCVLAGSNNYNAACAIGIDSAGNIAWANTYSKGIRFRTIVKTTDNSYALFGGASGGLLGTWGVKLDGNHSAGCFETPLTFTVTPAILNTSSYSPVVKISNDTAAFINLTLNNNGDILSQLCINTGTSENTHENLISISPNPFSTQTVLQIVDFLQNATLTVDNCFGQRVGEIKNINGQRITFNRDNWPPGLYFIRLTQDNKTLAIEKLVIQ